MTIRLRLIAAAIGAVAGSIQLTPAQAADFLGIPLWESYPGQYSDGNAYGPPAYDAYSRPSPYYYAPRHAAPPASSEFAPYGETYRPYYGDWTLGQGSGMYDRFGR